MLRSYSKRPLPASSRPRQTTVELLFLARRPSCSSVLWICGRLHQTSAAVTRRRAVFAVYSCCVKLDYTANRGRRSGLRHQMWSWPQWDVSNARTEPSGSPCRCFRPWTPQMRWGKIWSQGFLCHLDIHLHAHRYSGVTAAADTHLELVTALRGGAEFHMHACVSVCVSGVCGEYRAGAFPALEAVFIFKYIFFTPFHFWGLMQGASMRLKK